MPPERESQALAVGLEKEARALGFSLVGVTGADPSGHMELYRAWIDEGRHGEMGYLARDDAVARRAQLTGTMDSVRSVVVVAHEYYAQDAPGAAADPSRGIVARYARGASGTRRGTRRSSGRSRAPSRGPPSWS